MSFTVIFNVINRGMYLAAALSHVICGYVVFDLGKKYAFFFHMMSVHRNAAGHVVYDDYPLPESTLLVLPYVNSNAPIIVEYLMGLISLGLLLLVAQGNDSKKIWVPTCLGVSLLLGFLPLIFIAWAMSLPFSFLSN